MMTTVLMALRLRVKKLFLTYPQNDRSREDILLSVRNYFGDNLDWVVIGREAHQDGEPHSHVAIGLRNRCDIRRADELDVIGGAHGNYQAMKNQKDCLKYVTKDDADYLAEGIDVKAAIAGKASKFTAIANMMLEGSKLTDLVKVDPGFVLQHKRKLEEFQELACLMASHSALLPWRGLSTTSQPDVIGVAELVDWLNSSILVRRLPRSPQMFLWGPPGIGKSRLISQLSKYLRIYQIPREEEFYDEYQDEMFDLAVIDEFRSSKRIQWLNSWLDGHMMPLRKKGRQYLKSYAIPTIIISNWSLEDNYPKADVGREALRQRLLMVNILNEFVLDFTPLTAPNSPVYAPGQ